MTYAGYDIDSLHGDEDYFNAKLHPELYEDSPHESDYQEDEEDEDPDYNYYDKLSYYSERY